MTVRPARCSRSWIPACCRHCRTPGARGMPISACRRPERWTARPLGRRISWWATRLTPPASSRPSTALGPVRCRLHRRSDRCRLHRVLLRPEGACVCRCGLPGQDRLHPGRAPGRRDAFLSGGAWRVANGTEPAVGQLQHRPAERAGSAAAGSGQRVVPSRPEGQVFGRPGVGGKCTAFLADAADPARPAGRRTHRRRAPVAPDLDLHGQCRVQSCRPPSRGPADRPPVGYRAAERGHRHRGGAAPTERTAGRLRPDHPTTGGYPVVAVLRDRALDHLAQLRPATEVRFSRG